MHNVVFIDLDGVITDWYGPTAKLLNLDIDNVDVQNKVMKEWEGLDNMVGKATVVKLVKEAGADFWVNLPLLPWAEELIQRVKDFADGSNTEIAFLSKPGHWADAYKGKAIWVEQNYPEIPLILCRRKGMVASPTSFLIDDDEVQIEYFDNRGGYTFKWPHQFELFQGGEQRWKTELHLLTSVMISCLDT